MALHDEVVNRDLHGDNSAGGPLESIKNILGGEGSHRHEDIKTLAILFAFQVLVPGAIKLISYAANSVDTYFASSDGNPLGEIITPTVSTDTTPNTSGIILVNDQTLVEGVQTTTSSE